MRDSSQLREVLAGIDSHGYKAYKRLKGSWRIDDFVLHIDHVQGDPFAIPTRVRVCIDAEIEGLPYEAYRTFPRSLGTAAFLARVFSEAARSCSRDRGAGRSGEMRMEHPRQVVLPQTAVVVTQTGDVEARFTVGLPAYGRRVASSEAVQLLLEDVPDLVCNALLASAHDLADIELHASTNEDATVLREEMIQRGFLAFVADGSLLPRRSGVDDRPLGKESTVPFQSPDSMRIEIDLPNRGAVTGMGIGEGVTLIVGGGFHGKSTLLRALQAGVSNHRPGDGRELVVSHTDTVKIRAEDGRFVAGVNISPFIDRLPLSHDTRAFSTPNASGSTSQAAAIVEALEAGVRVLVVDEDTSATNFMIRDRRMQALVPKAGEPITPFVDRVRSLFEERRVSSLLVIGGSGDYLDVADRVIRMIDYLPDDASSEASQVAKRFPTGRSPEVTEDFKPAAPRVVVRRSIDPSKGRLRTSIKIPTMHTMMFGSETIDLAAVEQLRTRGQVHAIALALAWVAREAPAQAGTVPELLDAVEHVIEERGLDAFDDRKLGDLMLFRRYELAATMNRLRALRVE